MQVLRKDWILCRKITKSFSRHWSAWKKRSVEISPNGVLSIGAAEIMTTNDTHLIVKYVIFSFHSMYHVCVLTFISLCRTLRRHYYDSNKYCLVVTGCSCTLSECKSSFVSAQARAPDVDDYVEVHFRFDNEMDMLLWFQVRV